MALSFRERNRSTCGKLGGGPERVLARCCERWREHSNSRDADVRPTRAKSNKESLPAQNTEKIINEHPNHPSINFSPSHSGILSTSTLLAFANRSLCTDCNPL